MEFSRPEYWNGSLSLLQGIFPTQGSNPGIEPRSPALHADSLPAEPQGKTDFYFSLFRKDIYELDRGVYLSLLYVQIPLL